MSFARVFVIISLILLILNHFVLKNDLFIYVAFALAAMGIIFMVIFVIQFRRGNIDLPIRIVVETDVDKALADGVITPEQAENMPRTMVIDAKDMFLNLVFNLAIANHFDLIPVDVLRESLPNIPPSNLKLLYEESREISDDLNDYFRSQKFLNKADVIQRSDEIKAYLRRTYPWMDNTTLNNTYDYFFLGIGNG
ncbi:MAG: hypothetical protein IJP12_04540 [Methanobrevibacter sp.]|nr:hypothetical protein [Methanobrevibacter sp.]